MSLIAGDGIFGDSLSLATNGFLEYRDLSGVCPPKLVALSSGCPELDANMGSAGHRAFASFVAEEFTESHPEGRATTSRPGFAEPCCD